MLKTRASSAHHLHTCPLSRIRIITKPNTLPMPLLCALFRGPQLLYLWRSFFGEQLFFSEQHLKIFRIPIFPSWTHQAYKSLERIGRKNRQNEKFITLTNKKGRMLKQPGFTSSVLFLSVLWCNCQTYDDNNGPKLKKAKLCFLGLYNMFKKSNTGIGPRFVQK